MKDDTKTTPIDQNGGKQIKWTDCRLKSKKVNKKQVHDSTWSEFKKLIKEAPPVDNREDSLFIKPAEFKDSRDLEGLQLIYAISGDYDGEELQMADAALMLRKHKIESFIHPSFNWSPGEPRFRIYALLKEPVDVNNYARYVDRLNGVLGGNLARESWVPAQIWFASGNANVTQPGSIEIYGKCIDEIEGLPINSNPLQKKKNEPGISDEEFLLNLGPAGISKRDLRSDDELRENIKNGVDIHGSMMVLVARMVKNRWDGPTMAMWRDQFVEWVTESRGKERAHEIPGEFERLVKGAVKKGYERVVVDLDIDELQLEEVSDEDELYPLSPPCYVQDLFFQDVCMLAGPGGSNKSTITIHEAVTTALGRPLYGHTTHNPMKTLFLSGEDEAVYYKAKVQRIAQQFGLTKAERQQIYSRIKIVYAGNIPFTLCKIEGGMILPNEDSINKILWIHEKFPFDRIIIDPLVSFGVGEDGAVNDAHQCLIRVGRILRDNLRCMVEFVHHTGKANAQSKANDQYSFRGGSALADGCRLVRMVHGFFPGFDDEDWKKRTGLQLEDETGVEITTGKQTHSRIRNHYYLKRDNWDFVKVEPVSREELAEQQLNAARFLYEWIEANHEEVPVSRQAMTKNSLFEHHIDNNPGNLDENNDKLIKSKTQARKLLDLLLDSGCVESVTVPGLPNKLVFHGFREGLADEF